MATLAIDFDGVLCDPDNVLAGYRMGQPVDGAAEHMTLLRDAGHELVIHTTRASRDVLHVIEWLRYFEIPYDDVTDVKPDAAAYLDDRGVHFDTWPAAYAALKDAV